MRLDASDPSSRIAIASTALLLALASCAWIRRNQALAQEELLLAAGFTARTPTSPGDRSDLATLPKFEFAERPGPDGTPVYVFPDPENCRCLYVGDGAQYARYRDLAAKRVEERRLDLKALVDDRAPYSQFAD
jgi:hypothetical protein